ncbi:MAG: acyl-ACP--UDP-N-acetylglucosamine O-acyltransferase [Phycisphaerales bacterium]
MVTRHPTAIVDERAVLGDGCDIGPFCVISGEVTLGAGVRLMGSNYISGPTTIGDGCTLYPHCCIGFGPQDVKFKPGMTTPGVVIGKNGIFREHVTIHAASKPDGPTRLGDNVFMLANSHVGHDAVLGHNVTLINNVSIGGHASIGDNALFGGSCVVHQFCRVGRFAMIAGMAGISYDVPPFCTVNAINRIGGINRIGLRRNGFSREHITAVVRAYFDVLRDPKHREVMVTELRERAERSGCGPLREMAEFIAETKRGICAGMGKPPRDAVAWFKKSEMLARQAVPAAEMDDDL